MRSAAILSAAFAAGALATPFGHRDQHMARAIATEVVYVTETTTFTYAPISAAVKVASTTSSTYTSTVKAAPASATSSASAVPSTYAQKVVAHHNLHRANHSASDITWSDNLAAISLEIANSCSYAHNITAGGGGYGQNIAAGVAANNITAVITDLFYNGEINEYNTYYGEAQPSMANFELWGHFSQIVWKGTTTVGCATVDCHKTGLANVGNDVAPYFTVCNYEAPGNYANEYATNVGKPLGHATAQWNTGL